MISSAVQHEVEELRKQGLAVSLVEGQDGFIHVILENYSLPSGYSVQSSKLLVKLPASYPNGMPDMFWVDEAVRLANGSLPDRANPEAVNGNTWLRFSWHPARWNPGNDTLLTYLEFVNRRLEQRK